MKKYCLVSLAGALLALSLLFTPGCVTGPGQGGSSTNQVDQATLSKAATIVRVAVADGVAIAVDQEPGSVAYLGLAVGVLNAFIDGEDHTPATLRKALGALSVKELKTPYARIAINTGIGLYELYYGDYVRSQINGNVTALLFVKAIHDGIADILPK